VSKKNPQIISILPHEGLQETQVLKSKIIDAIVKAFMFSKQSDLISSPASSYLSLSK
jgi:hypothetical protein